MSALSLSIEAGIVEIGMDDGKVNALSLQMIEALLDALEQARAAEAAVLIHGRPGVFSGGYDRKLIETGGPACDAMRQAGDRLTVALLDFPGPVVMASTGHAMAKAAFMLLLADYRLGVAGPFKVGLNEVAIGMTMPDVGMRLARERIPVAWLSRCALQAQPLDPPQAIEAGFLDELLPPERILETARARVSALAAMDRRAYRETRRLLHEPVREDIRRLLGY